MKKTEPNRQQGYRVDLLFVGSNWGQAHSLRVMAQFLRGYNSNASLDMAALSCYFVIALVSLLLHQDAETVPAVERNRAYLAYNAGYDLCREVTDSTEHEIKRAVDDECEKAFQALDFLQLNTCPTWRHAACRLISGAEVYQCTCLISSRSHHIQTFRDCAPTLREEEDRLGHAPTPSINFQQTRRELEDAAWRAAEDRRALYISTFDDGAGSSGGAIVAFTTETAGTSTDVHVSDAAGSSLVKSSQDTPEPSDRRIVRLDRPHACDQCGSSFRSARKLFDHIRTHHAEGDIYCYTCNKDFKNRKSFLAHLRNIHPELAKQEAASGRFPEDPTELEAIFPFICDFCKQRYSSIHGLNDHVKSHTTCDTRCPVCPRVLSTRSSLKVHLKKLHPGVPMPELAKPSKASPKTEPEEGPFMCSVCNKPYATKKGHKDHELSHTTLDSYCIFCKKYLSNKANLKVHMRDRHPAFAKAQSAAAKELRDKSHRKECDQCGKRLKTARGLRDHKFFHEGKTTCEKCNSTFPRKSALLAHKRKEHKK